MFPVSLRSKSPSVIFASIILLGVIGITVGYRSSHFNPPKEPQYEEVTERYKQLASAQGEMSKWLLGLASGALAGLIGLRLKDPQNNDLVGNVPMAAYAFLILSLYGAFLSYDAAVNIFRLGPLNYLYGDQFKFPVLVQFWSLIGALILLGSWLLRPKTGATMLLLFLMAGLAPSTKAQELDTKSCLQNWYKDRLGTNNNEPVTTALSVIRKIQRQPHAKPPKTCVDVDSVLDQLRFSAIGSGKPDSRSGFNAYMESLHDELSNPDLSTSDVVHSIIEIMSPWDQPLAVLSIRASNGPYQILLNASQVGITNWTRRLQPGIYSVRIVKDFQVAYSSDAFALAADETRIIDVDKLKP